jgi:hypothetical protein
LQWVERHGHPAEWDIIVDRPYGDVDRHVDERHGRVGRDDLELRSEREHGFRFTGSPCFAAAKFEGTILGSDLTGTARAGAITVTMSATITSGSIDGTYSVGQAGACSNDTGTFTSQR